MHTFLLLTAVLGVPFGQNMLYNNSGILAAGACLSFQNGTWEQICSPADGQLDIKNAAGTSTLRLYTSTTDLGIGGPNRTDDANASPLTIQPSNVAANATAARTASSLILAGGLDSKTLVFDDANPDTGGHCAGTTTSLYVCASGTCGTTTLTYNTYCAGGCTTQAAACAALKTWINANATHGVLRQ